MKALVSHNPPLMAVRSFIPNYALNRSIASLNYRSSLSTPTVRTPIRTRKNRISRPQSQSNLDEDDEDSIVEDLRVPLHWSEPSKAMEESEWLRVTLHKWLDDEYCPEPTNVEISRVAAHSYLKSLGQKQTDLGEILLTMATDLESISYQESFHGAFSSANAAINLIAQRLDQLM